MQDGSLLDQSIFCENLYHPASLSFSDLHVQQVSTMSDSDSSQQVEHSSQLGVLGGLCNQIPQHCSTTNLLKFGVPLAACTDSSDLIDNNSTVNIVASSNNCNGESCSSGLGTLYSASLGKVMDGVGGVVVVGDNGTTGGDNSSNSTVGTGVNGSETSSSVTGTAAVATTAAVVCSNNISSSNNNNSSTSNNSSGAGNNCSNIAIPNNSSNKKKQAQMPQQQQQQPGTPVGSGSVSSQQPTTVADQLLGGVVSSPLHLGLTTDSVAPNPAVGVTSLTAAGVAASSSSSYSSSITSSSSSPASSSSAASVVPNFWSTASAEDTFLQGFQSLNGTVAFQQFPPNPSTLFGTGITAAAHMSSLGHMAAQQQATAPQRRAITAHHNFQQQQQQQRQQQQANILLNTSKTYPAWSSAPQPSLWTTATATAQPGGGNNSGNSQSGGARTPGGGTGVQGQSTIVSPGVTMSQSQGVSLASQQNQHHQQQAAAGLSPWASMPQQQPAAQQHHQQRRSVPSINPPVAPIKKPTFQSQPGQQQQQQSGGNPVGPHGTHSHQGASLGHQGPLNPNQGQSHPQLGQTSLISPSKFRRSTSFPGQMQQQAAVGAKPSVEITSVDDQRDVLLAYSNIPREMVSDNVVLWTDASHVEYLPVDRGNNFDSMRFTGLESRLLDLMRSNTESHEHYKARAYGRRRGKSPFGFNEDNHLLDDTSLDQTVPSLSSPARGSPNPPTAQERLERFSRKVFVGGLPPDIDEEEITSAFRRFGPLVVDWPHKAESKSYFPPKGYCFLLFQDEMSVQSLIEACITDDDKLYWCVSSPTMKDKPVQIRPWNLSDSDFVMDGSQPLDPRKTIFVGGVPRPLRALELALIMDRLYGGVCYAGIDTDPELKYPKGAGRVAFSNQQSYIAAISARFVQLQHADIDKRVEVKPYVLDDQMCDECQGARCGGKFAPFFCANVTCLQYYCENCWATIHTRPGREFHKPLVKEGADRPRAVPFRWC
ncbi:cytoplasmic polyadenylation element-binding protein 3 isoform X1 [Octopus bimaculoides]|uniref:cytoplasmic polyadenylation element-binding protein 3 isoform X1 n=1 Tax=Octopus bimaculoides TaxID=37653 RepID=UPI00071C57BB|nr:cytoplasmic polyadenylation element-binding protein 3 isoform X1 [Octopus bimaculoides]|eukprot:XP_014781584.1 PREDICTED: cytoplasmic polyadenylation element-binding protein 3-like isoform X1 [Octopus bimaculoides]